MQRVALELNEALRLHPEVELHTFALKSSWRWTHFKILPWMARLLYRIPKLVKQRGIDTILFSSLVTATLAVPLQRRLAGTGVRMMGIAHGRDVTLPVLPYQRLLPHLFGALDAVLPVSSATARECTLRGMPQDRVQVVPNGINPGRFAHFSNGMAARALLGQVFPEQAGSLSEKSLVLLSVGRLVERKGYAWFIEHVMPQLPEEVHYWIAGDGPMYDFIKSLVDRYGLQQRVKLLRQISEVELEALYRCADLFLMPNVPIEGDLEGFGIVMLESGLCGTPVIAAGLEGIRDVIAEGQNGHLLPAMEGEAFVRQIRHYAEHRDTLEELAVRAADYTLAHYSWSAVADQYVQVLKGAPIPVEAVV